jgi:hypothetical protein
VVVNPPSDVGQLARRDVGFWDGDALIRRTTAGFSMNASTLGDAFKSHEPLMER